jgi:hypothetical protein
MGGKSIKVITDFDRAGYDVEVVCGCRHRRVLPRRLVVTWFIVKGWPPGLEVARERFRCSRCGKKADRVGPALR